MELSPWRGLYAGGGEDQAMAAIDGPRLERVAVDRITVPHLVMAALVPGIGVFPRLDGSNEGVDGIDDWPAWNIDQTYPIANATRTTIEPAIIMY